MSAVERAIAALARREMVVVVDDADREDEGDLVVAAQFATPEVLNFFATHGRGLICAPMRLDRLDALQIPPMVTRNGDRHGTAFHAGVDHARLASTGISASDRAAAVRALADPGSVPADFALPGHVFPLAYREGGVLRRPGHTEASVDLVLLAGLEPVAAICEIASADGEMARRPELRRFAAEHGLELVTIAELIAYRRRVEQLVERVAVADLPLEAGAFRAVAYRDRIDLEEHVALVHGDLAGADAPLVRVHSECLTGDALGSRRCDCGRQLELAMDEIVAAGAGVVVYLRGHEGRGIGLAEKIRAYALQDAEGVDTIDANVRLGHPVDARDYTAAAQILRELGLSEVRLLTNNPAKHAALEDQGIAVVERVPLIAPPRPESEAYLAAKTRWAGHDLPGRLRAVG